MSSKPVFVLVPGAFHPEHIYQPLLDSLTALTGYDNLALTNPSVSGPDQVDKSTDDDANHARGKISSFLDQGRDVIVLAHSYGGFISGAAVSGLSKTKRQRNGLPGGVIGHIFISAGLDLAALGEEMEGLSADWVQPDNPSKGLTSVTPEDAKRIFFSPEFTAELAEKCAGQIKPQGMKSMATKASNKPSWLDDDFRGKIGYVKCTLDKALTLEVQEMFLSKSGREWHVMEMECGHSPFQSLPDETAK
ncbi:Hypothetical protein D9617_4g002410 [Elsinoe fawcettii]|nr:Hypothetical protein D9617_4g002410 [Elsinoe fawcettii]